MASAEESLAERQENELQILQAIYNEDVKDVREEDAWKVSRPPEVKITLHPQESMAGTEAHVTVVLHVKCPVSYPDELPELKLENTKGLSNQQMAGLLEALNGMARSLTGEVMILELCQCAQKFLHAHNKPPSLSFYDEMICNQRKQEEHQARQQQKKMELLRKKEEKQRQQIEDEIQKRQEALRIEMRRRRAEIKESGCDRHSLSEPCTPTSDMQVLHMTPIPKDTEQRSRSSVSPDPRTPMTQAVIGESGSYHKPERRRRTSTPRTSSKEDIEDILECHNHTGTLVLMLNNKSGRTFHRGRCIGHSSRGSTVYAGMDTKTGELVAIAEWVFKWRHASRRLDVDDKAEDQQQAAKYMKQVLSIEQELLSLIRLHHKNLVHYQALKYIQEVGKITVYVIMEYAGGWTLEAHLKSKVPNPVEILRHYTIQLVEVISYLHNKAVVHKDLRASSVLLDSQGRVRLSDYSLDKRLQELCIQVDQNRPGVHFVEQQPPTLGRGGKKGDIYRLGLLLLSLVEGHVLTEDLPEVPTNQPVELQDFLTMCLIKDERHRWSAHQLSEHSFIKTPLYSVVPGPKKSIQDLNRGAAEEPVMNGDQEDDEVACIPFIPTSEGGHSRLKNEFEILKWLGKGGFGDVIKVQNKLDSRYYAIKRIPLNPKSRQFTRKITREVKLLSRLNHENVVRYYNSWIETSDDPAQSSDASTTVDTGGTTPSTSMSANPFNPMMPMLKYSIGESDDIEKFAPARVDNSVDWSVSCSNHMVDDISSSDEDEDEEDENDVFGRSFFSNMGDSDDGIVFEHNSNLADWTDIQSKNKSSAYSEESTKETLEAMPKLQFLYIQMEFCEKSTLRNCIDAGLYQEMDRVWRLFREIIEGLGHIHEQGMIHRDLKPVNIFLDSNDHVKIGDFGLATTDILTKTNILEISMNPSLLSDIGVSSSRSESLGDGSLTGKVGTALYVSPEMLNTTTKIHYNQKVDIYSLGVMFFEMCYKPLPTGMERVKVLTNLRQPTIDLPEDFDDIEMPNQAAIIKWLLNHDSSLRPTSQELLQSDYLPPPLMEEAELNEILRSTIANPESKSYKHMINAIFSQQVTPAMEFTFDIDLHKGSFSNVPHIVQRDVRSALKRIFSKHGAVPLTTPLLMPKSKFYEQSEQYVCQMDHSGGLVALPYDLRVPFARYIARNNVTNLKRYCIDRVYRGKKLFGLHPRELTECTFDIVTSSTSPSLIPDAEVLHVVNEIIHEFPVLQNRNYYVRINHTSLLKGILLYCGVPEEIHHDVLAILGDTKAEKQKKFQVQTRLCSLSLSDDVVMSLYRFVETEGPFGKVASMLRCITKTKGHAGSYAKKGLHEMEAVIAHAETLGCKLQPVLTLGLVYNISHFSGCLFQVVCNVKRKRKPLVEVLAAGGRYDALISDFKKPSGGSIVGSQNAVGVSISFEKVLAAVLEDEECSEPSACEVLVSSLGHKDMIRDKLTVAKDLWAAGLSADILHDPSLSLEEIQDLAKESNIPYIVILKDLDSGTVRVRSTDKDNKVIEKKVNMVEVSDYLLKLQQFKQDNVDSMQAITTKVVMNQLNTGEAGGSNQTTGNLPPVSITFLPEGTKLANNTKRRYESQIYSCISSALANISSKCRVEILGLELNMAVLKTIAANLEVDGEESAFENSISSIMEKHARHRKYLTRVFDYIRELKFDKKCPVLLLYGLKDDSHRILL